jgi:hypothetical protein
MDDLQAQVFRELEQIIVAVTALTGLTSNWNGSLELVWDADFKGKKRFSCDIQINAVAASQPTRWSTLIHEALHAVSLGYVRDDYQQFRGWEEGVVEELQRLLRPLVLDAVGIAVPESIFQANESMHRYNVYIAALEEIRRALEAESVPVERQQFYVRLLGTPLRDRPGKVLALGYQRAGLPRAPFIRAFSAANAVLTRRPL